MDQTHMQHKNLTMIKGNKQDYWIHYKDLDYKVEKATAKLY